MLEFIAGGYIVAAILVYMLLRGILEPSNIQAHAITLGMALLWPLMLVLFLFGS